MRVAVALTLACAALSGLVGCGNSTPTAQQAAAPTAAQQEPAGKGKGKPTRPLNENEKTWNRITKDDPNNP